MVPNSHTHMNDTLGQPWKIRTPLESGLYCTPRCPHYTGTTELSLTSCVCDLDIYVPSQALKGDITVWLCCLLNSVTAGQGKAHGRNTHSYKVLKLILALRPSVVEINPATQVEQKEQESVTSQQHLVQIKRLRKMCNEMVLLQDKG